MERLDSRPASTDPHGPCDDRVDVPLPKGVKADLQFVARAAGCREGGAAEYVRNLIYRDLYGALNRVESVARQALSANGRNVG